MDLDHEREDHTDDSRHGSSRRGDLSNPILRAYEKLIGNKALLLFLLFLAVYNLTLQTSFTNDCSASTYLPISIIKHGSITLDHFPWLFKHGTPYYLYPFNGNYYSAYGLGAPLLATPFYLPLMFAKETPFVTLLYLSKFAASFYVALSAALLFAAMRRLTREKWALYITLIYALATPAFCTSSQALWQHGPSQFLISLAIYFLVVGEERPFFSALAGLPLAFSVLVRTNNLVAIPPFLIYFLWKRRSQIIRFILWLSPGALLVALYNHFACGSFYTFPMMARYKYFPAEEFYKIGESAGFWNTPFWRGFLGNLVSPSRGLFITSPILLVAIFGGFLVLIKRKDSFSYQRPLYICFFLCFLFHLLLLSKWSRWAGGWSFGNRLMLDSLPFLCILFIPAFGFYKGITTELWKTLAKSAFIFLILLSVIIQIEGIVSYDQGSWNMQGTTEELAWSIENNQFFFYARNPEPVTPPLIKEATGNPARLNSFWIDVGGDIPVLHFHLSEKARLTWSIDVPDIGQEAVLENELFPKGENIIGITSEDPDYLKNAILNSPYHEVEVADPLIPVRKTYYFDAIY